MQQRNVLPFCIVGAKVTWGRGLFAQLFFDVRFLAVFSPRDPEHRVRGDVFTHSGGRRAPGDDSCILWKLRNKSHSQITPCTYNGGKEVLIGMFAMFRWTLSMFWPTCFVSCYHHHHPHVLIFPTHFGDWEPKKIKGWIFNTLQHQSVHSKSKQKTYLRGLRGLLLCESKPASISNKRRLWKIETLIPLPVLLKLPAHWKQRCVGSEQTWWKATLLHSKWWNGFFGCPDCFLDFIFRQC